MRTLIDIVVTNTTELNEVLQNIYVIYDVGK